LPLLISSTIYLYIPTFIQHPNLSGGDTNHALEYTPQQHWVAEQPHLNDKHTQAEPVWPLQIHPSNAAPTMQNHLMAVA
jgi:hypothetical protein